jgi:chlorobactene glucosyltransferase
LLGAVAMTGLLWVGVGLLPWIGLGVFLTLGIREPRTLPPAPGSDDLSTAGTEEAGAEDLGPLVSIIIPARNEASRIGRCIEGLGRFHGVPYEIIVVDDRSTDDTAQVAREQEPGAALRLQVVDGRRLPEGWFGKPWACRQGADVARGRLLLFVDADTTHEPELLSRTLAAMEEDDAQVLSLLGRQEVGTFGEKLVQPQVFTLIGLRFRKLDQVVDPSRWKDAIANGQFVLVTRDAYESIGGHEAVKGEVVEDLRLAQELTRAGSRLTVREGEEVFATRMYTSMRELVNGWTKNVAVGARQASGRWAGLVLPGILLFLSFFWLLPAVAVGWAGLGWVAGGAGAGFAFPLWAGVAWAMCVVIWAGAYHRFRVSPAMAFLYPLGTLVVAFIVLRSWFRGERRIEWKGRRYQEGVVVKEPSRG